MTSTSFSGESEVVLSEDRSESNIECKKTEVAATEPDEKAENIPSESESTTSSLADSTPKKGLRQLKKTCEACAKSKVKCNGKLPCERCNKRGSLCVYELEQKRGRRTGSTQESDFSKSIRLDGMSNPRPNQPGLPGGLPGQGTFVGQDAYGRPQYYIHQSPPMMTAQMRGPVVNPVFTQHVIGQNMGQDQAAQTWMPNRTLYSPFSSGFLPTATPPMMVQDNFVQPALGPPGVRQANSWLPSVSAPLPNMTGELAPGQLEARLVYTIFGMYKMYYQECQQQNSTVKRWFDARFASVWGLLIGRIPPDAAFKIVSWLQSHGILIDPAASVRAFQQHFVPNPVSIRGKKKEELFKRGVKLGSVTVGPGSACIECDSEFSETLNFAKVQLNSQTAYRGLLPFGADVVSIISVDDYEALVFIQAAAASLHKAVEAKASKVSWNAPVSIHNGVIQVDVVVVCEAPYVANAEEIFLGPIEMKFFMAPPEQVFTKADTSLYGPNFEWSSSQSLSTLLSWVDGKQ